jgi:hypothetical protein
MLPELTARDIDLLLESLRYSKRAIDEGSDEYASKRSRLDELDALSGKLKQIRIQDAGK